MPSSRSFSLLVVDPIPAFRDAVRMLVTAEAPDCDPVDEAADGREALEAVRRLDPDVVLLERVLPDRSGLKVLADVRRDCPAARVLLTGVDWDGPTVEAALAAGAAGVLPKHAAADRLVTALRCVAEGGTVRPSKDEVPEATS